MGNVRQSLYEKVLFYLCQFTGKASNIYAKEKGTYPILHVNGHGELTQAWHLPTGNKGNNLPVEHPLAPTTTYICTIQAQDLDQNPF